MYVYMCMCVYMHMCGSNSESNSVVHMLMSAGLTTWAWTIFKGAHPWRKLNPLPSNACSWALPPGTLEYCLVWSRADNHISEVSWMQLPVTSRAHYLAAVSLSSGSYTLLQCSLSFRYKVVLLCPSGDRVLYSLYFDQLWDFVIVSICYKKKKLFFLKNENWEPMQYFLGESRPSCPCVNWFYFYNKTSEVGWFHKLTKFWRWMVPTPYIVLV